MRGSTAPLVGRIGLAIGTAIAFAPACAQLFDDPIQCHADGDCTHFGAICDTTAGVCVPPRGSEGGGDSGVSGENAPDSGKTDGAPTPAIDPCLVSPKPAATIGTPIKVDGGGGGESPQLEITTATTLGCDKDWTLDGRVYVRAGATLTIAPGVTVRAKKGVGAALVVSRGARLVTQSTRTAPTVFTSAEPKPTPGDWDGILILGAAPPASQAPWGLDPTLPYGGETPTDDSGTLAFTRIEWAKNGVILAGAGTKTKIDSVEVLVPAGDGITFSGGTANASHLVVQDAGDDQFEFASGYIGHLQFLFGQKSPAGAGGSSGTGGGANGMLIENAHPLVYNATVLGDSPAAAGTGLVFRDGATVDVVDSIFGGWMAGLDAVGAQVVPGALRRSIFFANAHNPAFVEDTMTTDPTSPFYDDDSGFDEIGWFDTPGRLNALSDPGLVDAFDGTTPKPWATGTITTNAGAPTADGFFDVTASFLGAFRDGTDSWMTGNWIRFLAP